MAGSRVVCTYVVLTTSASSRRYLTPYLVTNARAIRRADIVILPLS